jgi:hypothetical protein
MAPALPPLALSALCAAPAAAQTSQPAPTAPARWHLDGSTDRCLLSRRLEGTPLAANFILRTIPGSGRYDVILAAPGLPSDVRRPGRRSVLTLSPGGTGHVREGVAVDLPDAVGSGVAFGPLPALLIAELARASAVTLADDQGPPLGRWTLPIAARAAEALAACEAEKLVDWGADPAGFEPGATPARPTRDPATWLTIRDFGLATTSQSAAYTVVFRLAVGADGKPTDCRVIESAGNVDLTGACRALSSRARYEPARDSSGNPIRSVAVHVSGMRVDVEVRIVP